MRTTNVSSRHSLHRLRSHLSAVTLGFGVVISQAAYSQEPPDQLTIVSGSPGGSWYPIAAGIAQVFGEEGVRANAEVGAGLTNMIKVSRGEAELGVTTSTIPPVAEAGEEPFEDSIRNVRALAVLFPSYAHIAVTEESGINSVEGLAGASFNTTAVGNSTQAAFVDILTAYGLDESEVETSRGSQSYAANAVKDGNLDGLTLLSAFPNGTYTELFSSQDMKLLSLNSNAIEEIIQGNPGYSAAIIPAGSYPGQEEDVQTVRSDLLLIANADMPETEAQWIVQTLLANIESIQGIHAIMADVSPEYMASVSGLELHPGAAAAYREAGVKLDQ